MSILNTIKLLKLFVIVIIIIMYYMYKNAVTYDVIPGPR